MAGGAKRKEKRQIKKLMKRSPAQKYDWLVSLYDGVDCIIRDEDKYRIYRRMEREFTELAELTGEDAEGFSEQESCMEYAQDCKEAADELEPSVPKEKRGSSRTVMMSAAERQKENQKESKGTGVGRFILLLLVVLVVGFIVCYKIPATRAVIGDIQSFMGMNSFALKSYRVAGDKNDGWESALEHEKDVIREAKPGYTVAFGKLNWIVLDKEDGKALLIADEPLKTIVYNREGGDTSWTNCSLRKRLNSSFINKNFYKYESDAILETVVDEYNVDGEKTGVTATDKVFIPCVADIDKYEDKLGAKTHNLRLRDPGQNVGTTVFISAEGDQIFYGYPDDEEGLSVRPMMWVTTE